MARHIADLKQDGIKPAKVSSMKIELLIGLLMPGGGGLLHRKQFV
jgi:hypothetical protein